MQIDLRQLRQAQALASHGSFTRAAAALNIAQPTLSRSITELEGRLGLALFTRHRSGVEPTDFGLVFLQQAALVVAQAADLEREVAFAKGLQAGDVSVGFGPFAGEALAPASLQHFASSHPQVRLRIQIAPPDVLVRNLRGRTADLIVAEASVIETDHALEVIDRLAPLPGYLVARSGHPLASMAELSIADALEYPFVQITRLPPRMLKPLLARRRTGKSGVAPLLPFPAIECPTVPLAVRAVASTNAVTIVSLGMIRRELEQGRIVPVLQEPWMRSDWGIMRLRMRTLGPAATSFVSELQRAHADVMREHDVLASLWRTRSALHSARKPSRAR
jgi:DNA-binding transcriptional LysR family regulator